MTITISDNAYWELFQQTLENSLHPDPEDELDVFYKYPHQLGQGCYRQIDFPEGFELAISDYQLRDRLILHLADCKHPLEYSFWLSGNCRNQSTTFSAGQYSFCGSGVAPRDICETTERERFHNVNVHMDPELFRTVIGDQWGELPPELQHLIRNPVHEYYLRTGTTTPAMQVVVQQILQCPYQGTIKRVYLHGKVMELMALLLEQEMQVQKGRREVISLKPDQVNRIHVARETLLRHLKQPMSLTDLARQVGLNDYLLKRGFRQVFGKTVFGYLHDYRLEQARQLLVAGEMKIAQVAQAVGFADRSYFAQAFRKQFGLNPKEYLKACQQKLVSTEPEIPSRHQRDRQH